jgi:hypothetical protein
LDVKGGSGQRELRWENHPLPPKNAQLANMANKRGHQRQENESISMILAPYPKIKQRPINVYSWTNMAESRALSRGGLSSLKYVGGTLFYDAASGCISVQHQHSFTAAETIQSKIRFEQEALQVGVSVDCYAPH